MLSPGPRALTGAILCGGASRRMGRDKASMEVGGESLLDRAISRLRPVADPILLAGGEHGVERPGCLAVRDPLPGRGPLGGVVAALRASPHSLCAIVAVDMPDLSAALLRHLAALWAGEDAVVPMAGGRPQPLHAVYASGALAAAEDALGGPDVSLRHLLSRLDVRFVEAASEPRMGGRPVWPGETGTPGSPDWAVSLNTADDIERWRGRSTSTGG